MSLVGAKKAAIKEAGTIRDSMITASSSTLNTARTQMQQAQESPSGSYYHARGEAGARGCYGPYRRWSLNSAYDSLVHGIDKEGNSYASLIGNEKDIWRRLRTPLWVPFSVIKSALLNEQTGVLGAVERDNKLRLLSGEQDAGTVTSRQRLLR